MCQHTNSYFCRLLSFFRIIDEHDYCISLSNIAMIVVIVKLALATEPSMTDLGAFFLALSGYNYKKYINKDAIKTASKIANAVTEAADKLTNNSEESSEKEKEKK